MKRNVTFLQYMRAHGSTPGPTLRPLLTGAVTGPAAGIPSGAIIYFSGAAESICQFVGIGISFFIFIHILLTIVGGMLYAQIFKRAANDRKGGWLFGASYGFLLWVIGPISLWQAIFATPAAVGGSGKGIFAATVVFGLILGLLYPWIHSLIKMKFTDAMMYSFERPKHLQEDASINEFE